MSLVADSKPQKTDEPGPYNFAYSLLGHPIQTEPFVDLMQPEFQGERCDLSGTIEANAAAGHLCVCVATQPILASTFASCVTSR